MKLVTNGKDLYAIRWGVWPFYQYFDLVTPGLWWRQSSPYYRHCWDDKEKAELWFGTLNPTVVNRKE